MVLYKVQAAFSSHPTDEKQPALLLNNPLPNSTISNVPIIKFKTKEKHKHHYATQKAYPFNHLQE